LILKANLLCLYPLKPVLSNLKDGVPLNLKIKYQRLNGNQ
jgi:hypothetical protein